MGAFGELESTHNHFLNFRGVTYPMQDRVRLVEDEIAWFHRHIDCYSVVSWEWRRKNEMLPSHIWGSCFAPGWKHHLEYIPITSRGLKIKITMSKRTWVWYDLLWKKWNSLSEPTMVHPLGTRKITRVSGMKVNESWLRWKFSHRLDQRW